MVYRKSREESPRGYSQHEGAEYERVGLSESENDLQQDYSKRINLIRSDLEKTRNSHHYQKRPLSSVINSQILKTKDLELSQMLDFNRSTNMDATRREPSTGQVRAKHRDQFAAVNFLTQVSKYDLDRMNLNLKQAKVEK